MLLERRKMLLKNILCRHVELIRNHLHLDRSFFSVTGRFVIADFGVSGRQSVQALRVRMLAQLARLFCVDERLFAIAEARIGRGRAQPSAHFIRHYQRDDVFLAVINDCIELTQTFVVAAELGVGLRP